ASLAELCPRAGRIEFCPQHPPIENCRKAFERLTPVLAGGGVERDQIAIFVDACLRLRDVWGRHRSVDELNYQIGHVPLPYPLQPTHLRPDWHRRDSCVDDFYLLLTRKAAFLKQLLENACEAQFVINPPTEGKRRTQYHHAVDGGGFC